jgi:hypothetical protein
MKIARLAGLILIAALTIYLTAAAIASAAAPEFIPGRLILYRTLSALLLWRTPSTRPIICRHSAGHGHITIRRFGLLVVDFSGCSSEEGSGCTVNSPGQSGGTIVTNELDGELGSVKKTEAASGVGFILLPTSGTTFATLEGTCLLVSPAPLVGTVAGEVTPVNGPASEDGKFIFNASSSAQSIKEINISGTLEKPRLRSLGLLETTESTSELATYEVSVEVT